MEGGESKSQNPFVFLPAPKPLSLFSPRHLRYLRFRDKIATEWERHALHGETSVGSPSLTAEDPALTATIAMRIGCYINFFSTRRAAPRRAAPRLAGSALSTCANKQRGTLSWLHNDFYDNLTT